MDSPVPKQGRAARDIHQVHLRIQKSERLHLARFAKLEAFIQVHSGFLLDATSLVVVWTPGNKSFDGRNVLHLERFVTGRMFLTYQSSREICMGGPCVIDFSGVEMVRINVPKALERRVLHVADALAMHAAITENLGISCHTLGDAIRCAKQHLTVDMASQAREVAWKANQARHVGLEQVHLGVTGFSKNPAHAITGSRNEADVTCVICHGTRLNGFSSCSWCKTAVIETVREPSLTAAYLMAVQEVNELEVENKVLEEHLAVYHAADAALDLATSHWSTRKGLCMGILEDLSQASGLPVGQLGEMYGVASDVDPHQLTAAAASATAAAVTAGDGEGDGELVLPEAKRFRATDFPVQDCDNIVEPDTQHALATDVPATSSASAAIRRGKGRSNPSAVEEGTTTKIVQSS